MKAVFFVGLILSVLLVSGQNNKATKLFNKGVVEYNNNNLRAADSLFSLSASLFPAGDVYFNLGVVKFKLADTCAACDCFNKAYRMGDFKAYKSFNKECVIGDTVYYDENNDTAIYFCVVNRIRCSDSINYRFYKRNLSEKDAQIVVLKSDLSPNEQNFLLPKFQIEEYVDNEVFRITDVEPQFPGGEEALMNFLCRNVRYPQVAREGGVQGTVYVQFVVRNDGSITDIAIVRGIGGGCDEESIRVVKLMPKWIPGKNNGQPVNVFFNLPIRFILQG